MGDGIFDNLTVNQLSKLIGNVGIGTTNPAGKLDVFGDAYIGTGNNKEYHKLVIRGPNAPNSPSSFQDLSYEFAYAGSAKVRAFRGGSWDTYLQFLTNSYAAGKDDPQVRMTIDKDGNVGIGLGTASPTEMLEVNGNVMVKEGIGIGIGDPRDIRTNKGKLLVQGDVRIYDNNLWLRPGSDINHGIGWYGAGKPFAGMNLEGPAIFGASGGALGTNNNGQKIALQWNGDGKGNVLINGILDCGGPIRTGDVEANGNIMVKGDVILTDGAADCAEEFDVVGAELVEPGTVMVIEGEGTLRPSEQAYDKRVAGVISGAGDLRPGITLDRQNNKTNRLPLALTGKVYCKIDAQYGSVELGDLLTSSPTCGYAMKADDPFKAFGSVIGKALRPMETGRGMIPILVALQ